MAADTSQIPAMMRMARRRGESITRSGLQMAETIIHNQLLNYSKNEIHVPALLKTVLSYVALYFLQLIAEFLGI